MCCADGGYCWIASYPKSGNTWIRLALASILNGGAQHDFSAPLVFAPFAAHRLEVELALDVESSDFDFEECANLRALAAIQTARDVPGPKYRRVHEAWEYTSSKLPLFPPEATLASLYIVRDPRDVAVSLAHHTGVSIDKAIGSMADPNVTWGVRRGGITSTFPQHLSTWSLHVTSWLSAMPAPLVLRYEDMKADPIGALSGVVRHLMIATTLEIVTAAVKATQFNVLRDGEVAQGFLNGQVAGRPFFRRGVSGGWRDTLTREQAQQIENDHGEIMSHLGYL